MINNNIKQKMPANESKKNLANSFLTTSILKSISLILNQINIESDFKDFLYTQKV